MRVNTSKLETQVLILANTRELIRQIMQVGTVIAAHTGVKFVLGAPDVKSEVGQILVSTPGWLKI